MAVASVGGAGGGGEVFGWARFMAPRDLRGASQRLRDTSLRLWVVVGGLL